MIHSVIKIAAIALNFSTFVIIVDVLHAQDAANLLLALSFVSIVSPILDFGYSRFAFSKMVKGLAPSIALRRVFSRIITCLPLAITASVAFAAMNGVSLSLLLATLLFGAAPLPTSIFRYFYILKEKHAAAVLIEAIQPFGFFILLILLVTIASNAINLLTVTLIYCLSHLLSFSLTLMATSSIRIKPLSRSVFLSGNSLGRLGIYTSTFSISLEQLAFSLWLFMPVLFYGYLGNSDAVVAMSVLQKILSLVVAMYSIYSVKKMHLMANGHLCHWGIKFTIMAIAIVYIAGIALKEINTLNCILSFNSDFLRITENLLSEKIVPPLLFAALFYFLHIQAYLLYQQNIKWRLLNAFMAVLIQVFLAPFVFLKLLNESSALLASLLIIIGAFFIVRNKKMVSTS